MMLFFHAWCPIDGARNSCIGWRTSSLDLAGLDSSVPSPAQANSKISESLQLLWSPWYHMNDRVKNNSPVVTFPFFRLSLRPVPNTVRYLMRCLKYKMLFNCYVVLAKIYKKIFSRGCWVELPSYYSYLISYNEILCAVWCAIIKFCLCRTICIICWQICHNSKLFSK